MNEKVLNAMFKFAKTTLNCLGEKSITDPVQPYITYGKVFLEDGSFCQEVNDKPNYLVFMKKHCNLEFNLMPDIENAARVLLDEGILKPPKMSDNAGREIRNPTFEQMRWFLINQLLYVVEDYLEITNSFEFNEEIFKDSYVEYENSWTRQYKIIVVTIPLIGFDSEVDRIELYDDLSIERFTSDEKTNLWNLLSDSGFFQIYDYAKCKFKICGNCQLKKDDPINLEKIINSATKNITAMRLLHPGDVGSYALSQTDFPPYKIKPIIMHAQSLNECLLPRSYFTAIRSPYYLAKNEIESFVKIFNKLIDPEIQGQLQDLDVAIRWFNQSYSRERDEDKVIDLTVALDSSLLFNIKDELKYRMAIRGSALLAKNKDPKDTYSVLRALYDARSSIVHNGLTLGQISKNGFIFGIPAGELLKKAQEIARLALTEYLNRITPKNNLKMINEEIDQMILKNLAGNVPPLC